VGNGKFIPIHAMPHYNAGEPVNFSWTFSATKSRTLLMMCFIIATLFIAAFAVSPVAASAENMMPYSRAQSVATDQPFGTFLEGLKAAIKKNKMGLVVQASATKDAASIGKTITGNHVLMIFLLDFAVRMLEAMVKQLDAIFLRPSSPIPPCQ